MKINTHSFPLRKFTFFNPKKNDIIILSNSCKPSKKSIHDVSLPLSLIWMLNSMNVLFLFSVF